MCKSLCYRLYAKEQLDQWITNVMYCEKLFNLGKLGKTTIKCFKEKVTQNVTNKSHLSKEPWTFDATIEQIYQWIGKL
jgi:hypothetical protein